MNLHKQPQPRNDLPATKHFTRTLIGLLALCLVVPAAFAAEPATAPAVTTLPKPDLSKPVWVIIQCDHTTPPALTEEQKKTVGGLLYGPFFAGPAGVGFALEGGRVTRPWLSVLNWTGYSHGVDDRTWSHTPISFLQPGQELRDTFSSVEATIKDGRLAATMKGTYKLQAPVAFDLQLNGTLDGAKIEGTWKGTIGGLPLQGTCVGAVLPAASTALDPQNAVYQILFTKQNLTAVVEVRSGKGVSGLARLIPAGSWPYPDGGNRSAVTKTLAVDAAGLSVIAGEPGAAGRTGTLKGKVGIAGLGDLAIGEIEVSPTGFGGSLLNPPASTPIGVRAYPIDDPIASQWKRWMQAIWTGTAPVEPAVADQARADADAHVCLPPPGQATQFLHRYAGFTPSFIYAPWFDFQPVAGAKKYRFAIGQATFEAAEPTAWLSPVWKDLPVGGHRLTLTALDADGKPLGEPQKRQCIKRAAFGGEVARSVTDEDLALELALRYPRTLAERHYGNIVSLWAVLTSPPHDPVHCRSIRCVHDPFLVLARWSPDPAERARAAYLADVWKTIYIPMLRASNLGSTEDYYTFGTIRQNLNNYLSAYEATGRRQLLDEVRRWAPIHARLIQPNGSWTWTANDFHGSVWSPFANYSSHFGRSTMDHNAAPYVNFFGRLRKLTGDDRHRDAELKGAHWLMHNGLRTGYWENQQQQSDPSDSWLANVMAVENLEYLLERAPATVGSVALAEDLARSIEDRWIDWGAVSFVPSGNFFDSTQLPMAVNYLRLYRATGRPIYRAKADALFQSYLIVRDPVLGLPPGVHCATSCFNRYQAESDDPAWALRYLELRRTLGKTPPAKPLPPEGAVTVLRLQNGVAKAEPIGQYLDMQHKRLASPAPRRAADPVFVYLDVQGGLVRQAIATTPTWDGPLLDYPQPGRLHWQEGMTLFHTVDASKLTVGPKGIGGDVVVQLKAPMPESKPVATTFRIEATPDGRLWSGRHDGGRVDGEMRPPAAAKAGRLWFEVDRAVTGGESWQNWALAQLDLPGATAIPDRAPRWLGNGNAGWSAEVQTAEVALTDTTLSGTMKAKVNYFGFRDGLKEDAKYQLAAFKQGLSFLAYWNTSEKFFGKKTSGKVEGAYTMAITPKPLGEHIEYVTSSKPVTPGDYEYRFAGQRIGDVVAGTVTIKGPDGKEHTCQFLGGVE